MIGKLNNLLISLGYLLLFLISMFIQLLKEDLFLGAMLFIITGIVYFINVIYIYEVSF